MMKEELVNRWKTEEGEVLLKEVITSLTTHRRLSLVLGVKKHAGRWDLRGAQLSFLINETRIESGGHGVTQKAGSLRLSSKTFESIDLSYADISYSRLEKCSFVNCVFEETKALEVRAYAIVFSMCIFRRADLSCSYIWNLGTNAGMLNQVEFIECNLSTCLFSFPVIESCVFINCNLKEVDFDGSRFKNCIFKGEIDSAWFRGYSINAQKSLLGVFNRVDPKAFPNLMERVNFSESDLLGVTFSHSIDLRQCIFPSDESNI
jgi:uncharacterized protein YjbI with pentapeptide repeats